MIIVAALGLAVVVAVVAVSNWLGPFPFGISRRDTTLLSLWNENRYQDVLTAAEQTLEERALDPQALTFGGFAHFYVGIDQATDVERQEHLARAILLLRKAEHVNRAPLEPERHYVLAKAYYHRGPEYVDLAVKYMAASVSAGYVADDSYSYLGLAYEATGDFELSATWFEAGIEDGDSAALRIRAADSRTALGDYETAEVHLEAALRNVADTYLEEVLEVKLAAVLIEQGRYADAESQLTTLIEQHPDSADGMYYLGVVYERTGRLIEARSMWRRARDLDPNHVKALESLANWEG